eukprot:364530-Chlamydomonas_euryale.AAC.2
MGKVQDGRRGAAKRHLLLQEFDLLLPPGRGRGLQAAGGRGSWGKQPGRREERGGLVCTCMQGRRTLLRCTCMQGRRTLLRCTNRAAIQCRDAVATPVQDPLHRQPTNPPLPPAPQRTLCTDSPQTHLCRQRRRRRCQGHLCGDGRGLGAVQLLLGGLSGVEGVESDVRQRMEGVETDVRQRVEGVETDVRQRVEGAESDVRQYVEGVKTDVRSAEEKLCARAANPPAHNRGVDLTWRGSMCMPCTSHALSRNSMHPHTCPMHPPCASQALPMHVPCTSHVPPRHCPCTPHALPIDAPCTFHALPTHTQCILPA